jgi:hypothetical protein
MGILSTGFNIAIVYKFLKALVTPFDQTNAYKLGIIDDEGTILKKKKTLKTQEEKDAYKLFDRMIWKLKRFMGKVPLGKTKLASFAAALWFLKEEEIGPATIALERVTGKSCILLESDDEFVSSGTYRINKNVLDLDDEIIVPSGSEILINEDACEIICGIPVYSARDLNGQVFPVTKNSLVISEDAPVSSAGGGNVAGLGVGPDGEPGMTKKRRKIARRGKFAGTAVFAVSNEQFQQCLRGKVPAHRYSRYLGLNEVGEEIRSYGRQNPKKSIILQNEFSGEMCFLKIAKTHRY